MNILISTPQEAEKDAWIASLQRYLGALKTFSPELFGSWFHKGKSEAEALERPVERIEDILEPVHQQWVFGAWNGLSGDQGIGLTGTIGSTHQFIPNMITLNMAPSALDRTDLVAHLKKEGLWIEP